MKYTLLIMLPFFVIGMVAAMIDLVSKVRELNATSLPYRVWSVEYRHPYTGVWTSNEVYRPEYYREYRTRHLFWNEWIEEKITNREDAEADALKRAVFQAKWYRDNYRYSMRVVEKTQYMHHHEWWVYWKDGEFFV